MFKRNVEQSGKTTIFRFVCRIFFGHIVNVIIALVVYFLVDNLNLIGIVPPDSLYGICVTGICLAFYLTYVYIHSWRIGQRDYNQVLYKHDEYQKWKPLIAAAISQIPGIILVVFGMLPDIGELGRNGAAVYYFYFSWFLGRWYPSFHAVYFVPVLIPLILVPVAYHMGYRGIYLANKVVYDVPAEKGEKSRKRK